MWRRALARPARTSLPDRGSLPEFALVDHHGRPFTRQSLRGSVWIIDFIFTRCAGQCPLMTQRMAALQQRFAAVSGVRLASISVDPSYDSPERLAGYAQHYGARDGQWAFLTGSEEAVFRLSREGFHLGVGKDGSTEEPVTHSVRFVLLDRAAHIRGYYDADDSEALRRLEQDARQLARGAR